MRLQRLLFALVLLVLVSGICRAADAPTPTPVLDFGGRRETARVGAYTGFVIVPPQPARGGGKPWIWFAPTIGRYPNASLSWLLSGLIAQGFHVCGLNVGETYGSPAAREAYAEFYQFVRRAHGLDAKARLLAQSRGGLNHYNFAADHPEAVACIAGIYPVADLRSYPGLEKAAPAYGLSLAKLEAELALHNPIDRLAPLARAGIPILHVHGDSDKTVPLERNSAVIAERYRALGGSMRLIVIPGAGHAEIPAFFQSKELMAFLVEPLIHANKR